MTASSMAVRILAAVTGSTNGSLNGAARGAVNAGQPIPGELIDGPRELSQDGGCPRHEDHDEACPVFHDGTSPSSTV